MGTTVGVLGIQGDFDLHRKSLKKIGITPVIVRWPEELEKCDALVMPGGESTTFLNILRKTGLVKSIHDFAQNKPIMGTCAGLITISREVENDNKMETLKLIDVVVQRNAYGRQKDSFIDTVKISVFENKPAFEGVFIRAPRIVSMGKSTEALGFYKDETVMVRNENILALTFHPELTNDLRIHRYFVESFVG
ncbi:MAG: pyridoxal 5'-phosphate synthase glutaminase subunit PdxT [bacterium]